MNEKIISERCIGYQKVMGRADAVIEQVLESKETQWKVTRRNGIVHSGLKTKPHIDIPQEAVSETK